MVKVMESSGHAAKVDITAQGGKGLKSKTESGQKTGQDGATQSLHRHTCRVQRTKYCLSPSIFLLSEDQTQVSELGLKALLFTEAAHLPG